MTRVLRLLLPALAAALLLAPTANAAAPGINISGPAGVDKAIESGAQYVRLFVRWPEFQPSNGSEFASTASDHYDAMVNKLVAHGIKPIFVVMQTPHWASGSADAAVPPTDASTYATFTKLLAAHFRGRVNAYELWNEPDESQFWHPSPDAAKYASLVKAAYPLIKASDPAATVVLAPTTGNNFAWIESLYGHGVKGFFDAAAVHTDTACLDRGPTSFYRDAAGRLAQFTFLGYRSVHDVMAAHGDGAKPIWMTELGWSTVPGTCERGTFAGQKPAGVSEADQATFLAQAYHCLAVDPYVTVAAWFSLYDEPTQTPDEMRHYGLLRADGTPKPAWSAFTSVTSKGDTLAGPCGDFDAPVIKVKAPVENQQFVGSLRISASATDAAGVGLGRLSLRVDGGAKVIRNFTAGLANDKVVSLDWQGAKKLSMGNHTITIEALDLNGNTAQRTIKVKKVRTLKATLATKVKAAKPVCVKRTCTIKGRLSAPGGLSADGKVKVEWQWKAKGKKGKPGRYKTIHSGLKNANKPFSFKQKLKRSGSWRVRVVYQGKPPLKKSASRYVAFKVR